MSVNLINRISDDIYKSINSELDNDSIGLWLFRYLPGKNILVTWDFIGLKDVELNPKIINDIVTNGRISIGEGSIGSVMDYSSNKYYLIEDTLNDPRAVVSEIDYEIYQKSALLIPLYDNDENLICVFDIFYKEVGYFNNLDTCIIEKICDIVINIKEEIIEYYQNILQEDFYNLLNKFKFISGND